MAIFICSKKKFGYFLSTLQYLFSVNSCAWLGKRINESTNRCVRKPNENQTKTKRKPNENQTKTKTRTTNQTSLVIRSFILCSLVSLILRGFPHPSLFLQAVRTSLQSNCTTEYCRPRFFPLFSCFLHFSHIFRFTAYSKTKTLPISARHPLVSTSFGHTPPIFCQTISPASSPPDVPTGGARPPRNHPPPELYSFRRASVPHPCHHTTARLNLLHLSFSPFPSSSVLAPSLLINYTSPLYGARHAQ